MSETANITPQVAACSKMFSSFQEDSNAIVLCLKPLFFICSYNYVFADICNQPAGVMALSFNLANIGGDDDEI